MKIMQNNYSKKLRQKKKKRREQKTNPIIGFIFFHHGKNCCTLYYVTIFHLSKIFFLAVLPLSMEIRLSKVCKDIWPPTTHIIYNFYLCCLPGRDIIIHIYMKFCSFIFILTTHTNTHISPSLPSPSLNIYIYIYIYKEKPNTT